MYAAGGSRTKANLTEAKALVMKRPSGNAVRPSASAVRAAVRAAYNIGASGGSSSNNNINTTKPALKSKFTERQLVTSASTNPRTKPKTKTTTTPTTTTTESTNRNNNKSLYGGMQTLKKDTVAAPNSTTNVERKKPPSNAAIALLAQPKHSPAILRLSQPKRVWNSNVNEAAKLKAKAEQEQQLKQKEETVEPIICQEIGIQTYEREILNYDMLVGDIKFLLPSKELVLAIDRKREDDLRQKLLKTERQFEEHSEHFGQHVSNLKEFLETGKITRRKKVEKSAHDFRMDRRIMQQMDEFLKRKVPKAESMTNIKERIKKKEKELLNLFDTVENIQI